MLDSLVVLVLYALGIAGLSAIGERSRVGDPESFRGRELCKSLFRRDAETNTRDACAPQIEARRATKIRARHCCDAV